MSIAVVNNVLGGSESSSAVGTSGSPLQAASFTSNTPSVILVFVRWYYAGGGRLGSPPVQDTIGNTYIAIAGATILAGAHNGIAAYYAENTTGGTSNVVEVATASPGLTYASIHVVEITGLATSGVVDDAVAAASASNSSNPASPTFSTSEASEIVVAFVDANGGTSVTSGAIGGDTATLGPSDAGHDDATGYVIFSSTQSGITANFVLSQSDSWDISVVSLLTAGGASPNPQIASGFFGL